jgi:hypothetical protein
MTIKYGYHYLDGGYWYATTEEEHGIVTVYGTRADLALAKTIFRTKKFRGEMRAPWAKVVLSKKGDKIGEA